MSEAVASVASRWGEQEGGRYQLSLGCCGCATDASLNHQQLSLLSDGLEGFLGVGIVDSWFLHEGQGEGERRGGGGGEATRDVYSTGPLRDALRGELL